MEDQTMIELWKSYDKKLEENLILNRKNTEDITKMKVQSFIASMKPLKIFTILVGLIWVGLVGTVVVNLFVHAFEEVSKFFLFSATLQLLLTLAAIWIYLYQLVVIHQVDISEPVLATQEKIARLKSSTLWVTRLLLLQLPVWTTFYLNEGMLKNGNIWMYLIQFLVTGSFTYLAIWLFLNIKFENRDKKWFRLIFDGNEWNPVMKSIELLGEIEAWKNEKM